MQETEKIRKRRDPHREAGLLSLTELALTKGHDRRTLVRAANLGLLRVRRFGGARTYVSLEDYEAYVRGDTAPAS